jgi:hypothetical protein
MLQGGVANELATVVQESSKDGHWKLRVTGWVALVGGSLVLVAVHILT